MAVDQAPEVREWVKSGAVKLQFLGDELRFAFHPSISEVGRAVYNFIRAVLTYLANNANRTHLRGVVLDCEVTYNQYRGCDYFVGPVVMKCADCLGCAADDEVLANSKFVELRGVPMCPLKEPVPAKWPFKDDEPYILYPIGETR